MYCRARFLDNNLGRFAQVDSVVPDATDSHSFDRYSYVYGPVSNNDPSGHCPPNHPCYEEALAGNQIDEGSDAGVGLPDDWVDDAVAVAVASGNEFVPWLFRPYHDY